MGRVRSVRSLALILAIVLVIMSLLPILTSCGLYEQAQQQFKETEQMAHDVVAGNDVTLENTIKQDHLSAGDVISGVNNDGETVYYDEKSGEYVTGAQMRANGFADSLKAVWPPVSIVSFALGFLIRRFVKSSATIRKLGLLFEIGIPVLLTIVVYVVCGMADSSMVHFFDGFF